jgi:hypothetical protein
MSKRTTKIGKTTVCSKDYGVTKIVSSGGSHHVHRASPCEQCPWRMDVPTGVFPPKAYQASAPTAYDAALSTFACHMSGKDNPATCAGFLMRHGVHNLAVRLSRAEDRIDLDNVSDGGLPLYPTYREMAIANGVSPMAPCLKPIRGNGE